ncbi:ATP phosphoribosyltransferase [Alphaproteobacteria bacterium]|nr:ATP phosphoribosyltransferase [Alphaproteobacteria bacterium]|tara:strand:- start:355 stop:1014 length:660 start_codon:yes stop_codon:yes gene_type:complete
MSNNNAFTIALPKGRILDVVLPMLSKIGIEPEESFFDTKIRKLKFKSNIQNIDIIRVRSFDVVTFLAYGAAQMAFVGSDVLSEFNHSEVYSPYDLNLGKCRMVVAAEKEMLKNEDPRTWSHVRVATKYPNITRKHFESRGVHAECIKLNGAMELAPSMGLCKRIVDLVETGSTLNANGLVEVEEICKVSTRLAINRSFLKTSSSSIQPWIDRVGLILDD